jgi:hypothetical protein
MRNLARLTQTLKQEGLAAAAVTRYQQFVFKNAHSIWSHDRLPAHNTFGLHWSGPVDRTDAARQTSALDAFNAACLLSSQ